jgi:hypothetical protein
VEACRFVRRRGSYIFQDNPLTDGGKAVNFERRPLFTPEENLSSRAMAMGLTQFLTEMITTILHQEDL